MGEDDLADLLRQHASRHSVPGAAIGILRHGAVTTAYYGVADVSTGEPITPETLFSLGSLTKSMVATVIARLAEAGRLSLDDPWPRTCRSCAEAAGPNGATLRDLLANRSGLPLRAGLEFGFDGRTDEDDGALSRLVAEVAAGVPAATFWSYTNVGWCVLGRVIETATDTAWEDAMRRHLRQRRYARDDLRNRSRHRRGAHRGTRSRRRARCRSSRWSHAHTDRPARLPSRRSADLLRFAALHLEDPSLAALRAVHAEVPIYGWLDSWCLGWARFDWEGGQVWGWDGVVNGERSVLRIMPEHQAAVVLMTNGSTGRAMYRSLFADLMESLFGISVSPLHLDAAPGAAGELSRFAGVYAMARSAGRGHGGRESHADEERGRAKRRRSRSMRRTFLIDAVDPDSPTVTFGAYDAAGRPGCSTTCSGGFHVSTSERVAIEGATSGIKVIGGDESTAHTLSRDPSQSSGSAIGDHHHRRRQR